MPSDLAPISTTTWVAVIFSTVPLMTLSSLAASSASVVKLSSAEAKSSVAEGVFVQILGSRGRVCADWCVTGGSRCLRSSPPVDSAGRSATEVEVAESRLWAVLSSGKVDGLSRFSSHVGAGTDAGRLADCWRESKVVLGPPWRTDWNNPSGRTSLSKPASKGNTSSVATASEQCQTTKAASRFWLLSLA